LLFPANNLLFPANNLVFAHEKCASVKTAEYFFGALSELRGVPTNALRWSGSETLKNVAATLG
jgi:hypothetical protein